MPHVVRLSAMLLAAFGSSLFAADDVPPAGPVRVACVGDSITFGAGVEDRDANSYPAVLGRLLGEGFEVRNFGVSGATLQKRGDKPYWTLDEFKGVSDFEPHVVVVKLGTNDTKPHNWHGAEPFKIDLDALIDHFEAMKAKPLIFLCTPAPVHKDNFGIRETVVRDEVVPTVKAAAERRELPLIDLYAALKEQEADFPDGVHPNAAGAKTIAETVAAAVKSRFREAAPAE